MSKAAIAQALAVAEAIRALKSVPSGHLYAQVMAHLTLDQYNAIIQTLKNAKLIREEAHLLTWIGPAIEPATQG